MGIYAETIIAIVKYGKGKGMNGTKAHICNIKGDHGKHMTIHSSKSSWQLNWCQQIMVNKNLFSELWQNGCFSPVVHHPAGS